MSKRFEVFIINCHSCNKTNITRNFNTREMDSNNKYIRIYFCSLNCKKEYLQKRKSIKYTICKYCGKKIKNNSKHSVTCKYNPENVENKKCEYCGKTHSSLYGSGRFCSPTCAKRFSIKDQHKLTKLIKCSICNEGFYVHKSSKNSIICPTCKAKLNNAKLINGQYDKICVVCGKHFATTNYKKQTCCKLCSVKLGKLNLKTNIDKYNSYRNKLSKNAKTFIEEGKIPSWNPRYKNDMSYPERFFSRVLLNNNIKYEYNKKCMKYWIDFAILEKNVALEIDGKQHDLPDRSRSDTKKDECLRDNGWIVYRIKWNEINSESGKILIKNKIENFIEFINNIN